MNANQEYTVLGGGSGEANETVYVTQAEYDALTPDEHTDYVIYDTNTSPIGIDAESVSFDNTQTTMQSDNVQDAIEEVFQSVSNGKELLADAITDKGVSTSATDSFSTMAGNIDSLMVGGKYTEGSGGDLIYYRGARYTNANVCYCFSSVQNVSNEEIYYCAIGSSGSDSGPGTTVYFSYNNTTKKIQKASGSVTFVKSYSRFKIRKLNDVVYVTYTEDSSEGTVGYFDDNGTFVFDSSVSATSGTDISNVTGVARSDISFPTTLGTMTVLINRGPNGGYDNSDRIVSVICL